MCPEACPLLASFHDVPQCVHKYASVRHFAVRASFNRSCTRALFNSQSAAAGPTTGKHMWYHLILDVCCGVPGLMGSKRSMMLIQHFTVFRNETCIGNDGQRELISAFVIGVDELPFQALPTQRSLLLYVHASFGTPETLRAYMQRNRHTPYSNLYATESCVLHSRKP